jgi:hypothetical protein
MRKLNGCRRVAQPQIEYKTERAVRDFSRNTHTGNSDRKTLMKTCIAALIVVIVGGAAWVYTTKDWNASGTQKVGSPYSTAPSEGGKPLVLTK